MRDIKIQQETQLKPAELEIAQQLPTMHRQDGGDGFELDHNEAANEKIEPVTILNSQLLVSDGDRHLAAQADALLFGLVNDAPLLFALQQAVHESRMNLHRP